MCLSLVADNDNKRFRAKITPPRLGGRKLGVFATRSPHRCASGLFCFSFQSLCQSRLAAACGVLAVLDRVVTEPSATSLLLVCRPSLRRVASSARRWNPLGLSVVKLDRVEGRTLHLSAVDLIDGTPISEHKVPCFCSLSLSALLLLLSLRWCRLCDGRCAALCV